MSNQSSFFLSSLGGDSSDDEEVIEANNLQKKAPKKSIPDLIAEEKLTNALLSKGGKSVPISSLHPSWRTRIMQHKSTENIKWGGKKINLKTGEIKYGVQPVMFEPIFNVKPKSNVLKKMRDAKKDTKDIYQGMKRKELKKIRSLQFVGKRVKF
jgi:hypothetical protein